MTHFLHKCMKKHEVNVYINPKLLNAYQKNKRYTVAHGGRGSGKSLQFGILGILFAIQNPNSRILAVRGFQNKITESSLQIFKDVIDMLKLHNYFEITENTLKCSNGSEFLFYGAKSYQSFKSLQGIDLVFVDEATEVSKEAWEVLIPTIRNENSRFLISFNPTKESDWVYTQFILNKHPDAEVVQLNYYDNPFFPTVLRREMEYDKATNLSKYYHVWEGKLVQAVEGALWSSSDITYMSDEDFRTFDYTTLDKIIVSVDPSTTDKATSDACGLVVVGSIHDKYVVLEDATAIMSPKEWATKSIALYNKWEADGIVAEVNQGGDMVKTIIHQIDDSIPVKSIYARRGKMLRAEPIQSLYQAGKVMHYVKLPGLEYEMQTYAGKGKSPNALDALVHGLTFLSKKPGSQAPQGLVQADMTTFRL